MKVASLIPYKIIPPQKGGEKAIYYFWKALADHAGITAYTVIENSNIDIQGISVESLLSRNSSKLRYVNLFLYFKIRNDLNKKNINTIIIEHPYFGWLGMLLKKYSDKNLIVRSHNIEGLRFKTLKKWWWGILYNYEKWVHQHAGFNFFITEEDRQFAIQNFKLCPEKTAVITYGIQQKDPPSVAEKDLSRRTILETHQLSQNCKLLLFAAPLQYKPNLDALDEIIYKINPVIKEKFPFEYRIIICGGGLPGSYNRLKAFPNMIYAGFVNNIESYFNGADIFLNPIVDGGGIKTKLVEALAANTAAVSYKNGAIGVPGSITGNMLQVIANSDYQSFANAIVEKLQTAKENIAQEFFEYFNWNKIAEKAVSVIESL